MLADLAQMLPSPQFIAYSHTRSATIIILLDTNVNMHVTTGLQECLRKLQGGHRAA